MKHGVNWQIFTTNTEVEITTTDTVRDVLKLILTEKDQQFFNLSVLIYLQNLQNFCLFSLPHFLGLNEACSLFFVL